MKAIQMLLFSTALLIGLPSLAGEVQRAQFTTAVENREPVDRIDSIDRNKLNQVTFFTDLHGFGGQQITHQWIHDDRVYFEKTFNVGSDRWRTWTTKSLHSGVAGIWIVNVLGQDGQVLSHSEFLLE